MKINWKLRLKSKAFWVSVLSLSVLFVQQIGLDPFKVLPQNYLDILNTIFAILAVVGIVVDPTTEGLNDSKKALTYTERG